MQGICPTKRKLLGIGISFSEDEASLHVSGVLRSLSYSNHLLIDKGSYEINMKLLWMCWEFHSLIFKPSFNR